MHGSLRKIKSMISPLLRSKMGDALYYEFAQGATMVKYLLEDRLAKGNNAKSRQQIWPLEMHC
jgi:hypothetical protein